MMNTNKKSSFTGSIGFVLVAAGSAVGVGNIWRFPYLAAKDGGGIFLLTYLVLVLTFGFSLLTTDVAIGRKTQTGALHAFEVVRPKWKFLGYMTFLVPIIIMTYYSVIGGWILKYATVYLTGGGNAAASDGFFTSFITSQIAPIFFMLVFLAITAFIVYCGVEKGIEKFSKIIMPGLLLLIIGIAFYSLTLSHTDSNGVTRAGLQGLMVYLKPNFQDLTIQRFLQILLDAMSQLFFSLSVSMGIMITYGSYVKKDVNLNASLTQIELFDTLAAFLSGMMIIPAVFVFFGTEGMSAGPSLMFVSLPKVFYSMGSAGNVIGLLFFLMVLFAAITSNISIMETIVSNCMDIFHQSRKNMSLIIAAVFAVAAAIICLSYNIFYVELLLPNGSIAQLLDLMDYISNNLLMPLIALFTSVFVGWVVGPNWIREEMELGGHQFRRRKIYSLMTRYVTPCIMLILFLQALGIFG